jgi:hypothetical protein
VVVISEEEDESDESEPESDSEQEVSDDEVRFRERGSELAGQKAVGLARCCYGRTHSIVQDRGAAAQRACHIMLLEVGMFSSILLTRCTGWPLAGEQPRRQAA